MPCPLAPSAGPQLAPPLRLLPREQGTCSTHTTFRHHRFLSLSLLLYFNLVFGAIVTIEEGLKRHYRYAFCVLTFSYAEFRRDRVDRVQRPMSCTGSVLSLSLVLSNAKDDFVIL